MAEAKKTTKKASKAAAEASGDISIIETGAKQYIVAAGSKIKIEKLAGEHKVGDKISFDKVLLSQGGDATTIGTPYISGATVSGEITKISRHPKVTVIKYKAKSRYFKKRGHRQPYFEVQISEVA